MLSVDAIEALADSLTPAQRHVLLRCSEAAWGDEYVSRQWFDVVHGRKNVSFYGTVRALERRGLVKIGGGSVQNDVALTREGGRVQAELRLRELDVQAITK